MTWVLLLMVMSSKGEVIVYDQGHYTSFGECNKIGTAMLKDLDSNYKIKCIRWEKK